MQVIEAVDQTQEPIADIPVREPPPPPRHTAPHFHATTHYFVTEKQNVRRLVSGPMLVGFQPLNRRDAIAESKRITKASRDYFNVLSQRGMFKMQLQVCSVTSVTSNDSLLAVFLVPLHLPTVGSVVCVLGWCMLSTMGLFTWIAEYCAVQPLYEDRGGSGGECICRLRCRMSYTARYTSLTILTSEGGRTPCHRT